MIYDLIGRREHEWAGLTTTEVREVGVKPGSTLVILMGGIEQHGRHLPVVTDLLLVEAMVGSTVEQTDGPPVVVSLTVWSEFLPHHLISGETLPPDSETIRMTFEDITHTGLQNNLDAVPFVSDYGSNDPLIGSVVNTVGVETDAGVLGITYFELAIDRIEAFRDIKIGGTVYGGELEASLVFTVQLDLVDDSSARNGELLDESYRWSERDPFGGGSMSIYRSSDTYSEMGATRLPGEASTEKGERIRSIIVEELALLLDAVREQNA